MKMLRITDSIRVVRDVPFDDEHYPDMTIEEAVAYEASNDDEARWESVRQDSSWQVYAHRTEVDIIDHGDNAPEGVVRTVEGGVVDPPWTIETNRNRKEDGNE